MRKYLTYLKGDKVIWIISLLMLAFSLVSVYSFVPILVKIEGGTPVKYLSKHLLYVVIGFALMYWIHKREAKNIYQFSRFAFVIAIGLLIFTLFFGAKVNDAGRWIRIPFVGLTFQSSDFAKYALIVYLARMMVKKKGQYQDWIRGFGPVMIPVVIICGLIVKDNFSTAALLFLICLSLFFIGKVSFVKTTLSIAAVLALFGIIIVAHKTFPEANIFPRYETWENRINNKMNDQVDVLSNAQALNAELAIYNGSIFGEGVGDGKLKEYLPEAYADFYYASFVEEFGSIFAIVLVLGYLILLFRIFKIGIKSDRLFETYASIGIGILLLTQASVNMLVCTGVFPVTGQNMPLLAMGGSALIMTCVGLGVVQSFAYRQERALNDNNKEEIA
jgi:cell division protein FtsW